MESEWRDIPGFDGMYQISRDGEIRSWRDCVYRKKSEPKILKQFLKKNGKGRVYVATVKGKDGKRKQLYVMRIMAEVWFGVTDPSVVAYHKNGDTRDHCVNNIGFSTRKAVGKIYGERGNRKPVVKIAKGGEIVAVYKSAKEAAKKNHYSYSAMLDRLNGKVKNSIEIDGCLFAWDA